MYICFSHLFKHMTICLHFPDYLAYSSRRNSILFGNTGLLITYHYCLVCNLQNFRIRELWPVLDLLFKVRWCFFCPIGWINIVIPHTCDRVPALQPLCQPVNSLQVCSQASSPMDIKLQSSFCDLSSELCHKLSLLLQFFKA